jgi:hypothetical protein
VVGELFKKQFLESTYSKNVNYLGIQDSYKEEVCTKIGIQSRNTNMNSWDFYEDFDFWCFKEGLGLKFKVFCIFLNDLLVNCGNNYIFGKVFSRAIHLCKLC